MTYAAALEHFKTVKAVAKALGVTQSLVYSWGSDGFIPEKHAIQLHLKSGLAVPIKPEDYIHRD